MGILRHICRLYRIWKKVSFSSRKKQLFCKKNEISYVFEKSYYFVRIQRKFCDKFLTKIFEFKIGQFSYFAGILEKATKI